MPKVVVLESVERECVYRLSRLDFSPSKIKPVVKANKFDFKGTNTDFITYCKRQLIDNPNVKHVQLSDALFSCPKKEKDLYFFYGDLLFPSETDIQSAILKLDTLFQLAKERNIQLFYVIASDKYDVYQQFIMNNEFPKKELLENFINFEANPYFVNTKHILVEKARQGVKDLYYADDTHWSPVGEKIVAEEIAKRMDFLGLFKQ